MSKTITRLAAAAAATAALALIPLAAAGTPAAGPAQGRRAPPGHGAGR